MSEEFLIYMIDDGMKMYFTGTHWGGPGYLNQPCGAYRFDTQSEAEECRKWLDEELVVPKKHFTERINAN